MTVTANTANPPGSAPPDLVTVTIDDTEISVPKGTLVIRAAEQLGIAIPRFCDHPLLAPAGACRQCLVEVATPGPDGTLRPMPKPQASCAMECTPGMVVRTQKTSPVAEKAQRGIMEFLLINHPLDCPVCDKGGECPLQNQALANGRSESRFVDTKRTFAKPIRISTQVLLDRERCILCQRCTRFSQEIAGDPFIDLQMRGADQQIGTFSPEVLGFHTAGDAAITESGQPFASYFSGNTVQICPVGALTGAAYRFRARPFDLVSTPGVCEHCSSGCALRVDHRRGAVTRRLAGEDAAVNEDWNCDKGRWAFTWTTSPDRITHPMVRDRESGELQVASWPEALAAAAYGLAAAKRSGVGVLVGGRVTVEDAYAYAKFARVALGTNDVDFRARPHSAEETHFLANVAAGRSMGPTYRELESAPAVLLLGFEPEEESPIVFLRLRKAVTTRPGAKLAVYAVASWASRGLEKLNGTLIPAAPGTETEVIQAIAEATEEVSAAAAALRQDGAVIMVGERLASVPGALTAAVRLAQASGARLAWVPRRAGERGALEAGALPGLLPGGRPVSDPRTARVDVAATWEVDSLPTAAGRDTAGMIDAAARGDLGALIVGGVDPRDLPDPGAARKALDAVGFLVSLEVRSSEVTQRADVVLPVAPVTEKAGTFLELGGPLARLPGGPDQQRDVRLPRAGHARRPSGRRPRPAHRRAGAGRDRPTGGMGRSARTRPGQPGHRAGAPRGGVGGPGHLADAARRRPAAGRRGLPGRHRAPGRGPALGGHRGRDRAGRRGGPDRLDRERVDHRAVGDHTDAGPGGLAADEFAGLHRAGGPGRRCRSPGLDQARCRPLDHHCRDG